jgi:hypothetical protein
VRLVPSQTLAVPDFIVISVINLITCKAAAELKLFQNKKNETARLVPSQT